MGFLPTASSGVSALLLPMKHHSVKITEVNSGDQLFFDVWPMPNLPQKGENMVVYGETGTLIGKVSSIVHYVRGESRPYSAKTYIEIVGHSNRPKP